MAGESSREPWNRLAARRRILDSDEESINIDARRAQSGERNQLQATWGRHQQEDEDQFLATRAAQPRLRFHTLWTSVEAFNLWKVLSTMLLLVILLNFFMPQGIISSFLKSDIAVETRSGDEAVGRAKRLKETNDRLQKDNDDLKKELTELRQREASLFQQVNSLTVMAATCNASIAEGKLCLQREAACVAEVARLIARHQQCEESYRQRLESGSRTTSMPLGPFSSPESSVPESSSAASSSSDSKVRDTAASTSEKCDCHDLTLKLANMEKESIVRVEKANVDFQEADQKIAGLRKQLEAAKEKCTSRDSLDQSIETHMLLSTKLLEQTNVRLEKELERCRQKESSVSSQVQTLTVKAAFLNGTATECKLLSQQREKAYIKEKEDLLKQISELRRRETSLSSEILGLTAKVASLDAGASERKLFSQQHEEVCKSLSKDRENLQREVSELRQREASLFDQVNYLNAKITTVEGRATDCTYFRQLEDKCSKDLRVIAEKLDECHVKQLNQSNEELASLRQQVAALAHIPTTPAADECERQKMWLNSQISELKEAKDKLTSKVHDCEMQVLPVMMKHHDCEKSLESSSTRTYGIWFCLGALCSFVGLMILGNMVENKESG